MPKGPLEGRRSKLETLGDVLEAFYIRRKDGEEEEEIRCKKTNIMYKANLSFEQLNEWLEALTESDTDLKKFLKLESVKKRRSKNIISTKILELAKRGEQKTKIMFRGNLSFEQLNKYLGLLEKFKLIKSVTREYKKTKKIIYTTTAEGIQYLQTYTDFKSFLSSTSESLLKEIEIREGIKEYKLTDSGRKARGYVRDLDLRKLLKNIDARGNNANDIYPTRSNGKQRFLVAKTY